jgi:hypothetical protein
MAARKGLDGRSRDANGEIRRKRGDTRIRTIREEHPGFAPGWRSDARLDTVLEETGALSLRQLLKDESGKS